MPSNRSTTPRRPRPGRLLAPLGATLWRPTPNTVRGWALACLVANFVIVASGALVRITESGLGCPTWPRCTRHSVVPVGTGDTSVLHMAIEFGNRVLSSVVLAVTVACVVAVLRLRPRRRVLTVLAWIQVAGVLGQALLGGLVVRSELQPVTVAAHYLLSAAILAAAVALRVRAGEEDGPVRPLVRREITWAGGLLLVVAGAVLVLGTIVTGSGPHGGDPAAPRFELPLEQMTKIHSATAWLLLLLTVGLIAAAQYSRAPNRVCRRLYELAALILAQGALGYTQYALGLPETLVWLHVLGSVLMWLASWRLWFSLRDRDPAGSTTPVWARDSDPAEITS